MTLVRPYPHKDTPSGVPIFNFSPLVRLSPSGVMYSFNSRIHRCRVAANRPCGRLYAPDEWIGWSIARSPNTRPVASGPIGTSVVGRAIFNSLTRPSKPKRIA